MKSEANKKIHTIGRAADNSVVSEFEDVSEHHARILVVGREMILEDLNSTNGTFVNGSRIRKAVLKPTDQVSVALHPLNIRPIFAKLLSDSEFNDYTEEFNALKTVYDEYEEEKEKIIKESQRKTSIKKFLIMSLPVILFAFFFFGKKYYYPIYMALNSVLTAFALFLANDKKKDEKLKQAKIEFTKKYRCPRCKTYQLSKEWELHRDDKQCPNCKATWAKEYIPDF